MIDADVEQAYSEACRAIGELTVANRLLQDALAQAIAQRDALFERVEAEGQRATNDQTIGGGDSNSRTE